MLPSNADWDCFKTVISLEILKIQNPLLEEHCAFFEVVRLFQWVGCARNKLLFLTDQQNLKSSLLDTWLRLDGLLALELWDLIVSVLGNVSRVSDRTGRPVNVISLKRKSMWWKTLILFPQMSNPQVVKLYCMCLRTMKLWSKWLWKAGVQQMRHVSRTHRVALDWLFDRINLDPKIQIKYIDTKNQLADILTKGKLHTWWMESSFVFVQHWPFQFH